MIVIFLTVVSGVALAAGLVADQDGLLVAAAVLAFAAFGVLVIDRFRPRRAPEVVEPISVVGDGKTLGPDPVEPAEEPAFEETPAAEPDGSSNGREVSSVHGGPLNRESDTVALVPGRRRFHVADCSLIEGLDVELVTELEAKEEGYSACTRCAP